MPQRQTQPASDPLSGFWRTWLQRDDQFEQAGKAAGDLAAAQAHEGAIAGVALPDQTRLAQHAPMMGARRFSHWQGKGRTRAFRGVFAVGQLHDHRSAQWIGQR